MKRDDGIYLALIENQISMIEAVLGYQATAYDFLLSEINSFSDVIRKSIDNSLDIEKNIHGRSDGELSELAASWYGAVGYAEEASEAGLMAFSVILSSWVENELKLILINWGDSKPGHINWKNLKEEFQSFSETSFDSFGEYVLVEDIRNFANQFKHNDGNANKWLANRYIELGFKEGSRMDYSKIDWRSMIFAAKDFLISNARAFLIAQSLEIVSDLLSKSTGDEGK